MILHLDIETYSSEDLKSAGVHRYASSPDFEIMLLAYAYELDGRIADKGVIDLAQGETIPKSLLADLINPDILKVAHNAAFERVCLRAYGTDIPPEQWECSMVRAMYCGLPGSLDQLSTVLQLGDSAKMREGKALIRYFTVPCSPTKTNGQRERNLPEHAPEKWQTFKEYCMQDVIAEMAVCNAISHIEFPESERIVYAIDQRINDNGMHIDVDFVKSAIKIDEYFKGISSENMSDIAGIDNPNSSPQLKKWIENRIGVKLSSLDKESISELLSEYEDDAVLCDVLRTKQSLSKTSTAKYQAMLDTVCNDDRAYGALQFYGAGRTGRWSGRRVQPQNMPRNYLKDLDFARGIINTGDAELAGLLFNNVANVLSQLTRTAITAPCGKSLAVCDFSAIEARVLAWLAGENWRLEVFRTHGKIYEASASKMFKVPIEQITKTSEYRQRGKVAELALGYQGSVGAMRQMDTEGKLADLSDAKVKGMVEEWRKSNPAIVQLWYDVEGAVIKLLQTSKPQKVKCLMFSMSKGTMLITLPSGRQLCYHNAKLVPSPYGGYKSSYMGVDSIKKTWTRIDSYGGKYVENIVQAISRDLMSESIIALYKEGFRIAMHVHDEIVCEVPVSGADTALERMRDIMTTNPKWCANLPLSAEGFTTSFYKKD